jgi:hypothetical protein
VRTRDRKLVYYDGDGCGQPGASDESRSPTWELFDLATDPYELRSVHDNPSYGGDVPRLRAELARLIAEVGDDLEPPRSRRGVADRAIGAGSWRTPPSP